MPKTLILRIPKGLLGEPNAKLLGLTLVQKLLEAAFARADIPKNQRRRFHLIADEYQLLASTTFPSLQSEAAKFGIDTVVAHQFRDQLDRENKGSTLNVGNLVIFRISGKDASELAREFDNTPPEPLVVGEREVKGLSHSPWLELERGSHSNPRMAHLVQAIKPFFVRARLPHKTDSYEYEIITFWEDGEISLCLNLLDAYLAARMRGVPIEELSDTLLNLVRNGPVSYLRSSLEEPLGWSYRDDAQVNRLCMLIFSANDIDEIREGVKSLSTDSQYFPRDIEATVRQLWLKKRFIETVMVLAACLEKEPILSPTGQTEPIYETRRSYADVEAETANKLANLMGYQARCKLVEGRKTVEYVIETFPPPEILDGGRERAKKIRQRSRQEYGQDRKEVAREVEKRLRILDLDDGPVF